MRSGIGRLQGQSGTAAQPLVHSVWRACAARSGRHLLGDNRQDVAQSRVKGVKRGLRGGQADRAVGDAVQPRGVVADDEDRGAGVGGVPEQVAPTAAAVIRSWRAVGSSATISAGRAAEGTQDGDALALPAGQLAGTGVEARGAPTPPARVTLPPWPAPPGAPSTDPSGLAERAPDGPPRIQARVRVLEDGHHVAGRVDSGPGRRLARPGTRPAYCSVPRRGASRPAAMRSSVDFPVPDGPPIPTISPGASDRSMPSRTVRAGRPMCTSGGPPANSTTAVPVGTGLRAATCSADAIARSSRRRRRRGPVLRRSARGGDGNGERTRNRRARRRSAGGAPGSVDGTPPPATGRGRQQRLAVRMARLSRSPPPSAPLDDPAPVHHRGAVGVLGDEAQVVADQEQRVARPDAGRAASRRRDRCRAPTSARRRRSTAGRGLRRPPSPPAGASRPTTCAAAGGAARGRRRDRAPRRDGRPRRRRPRPVGPPRLLDVTGDLQQRIAGRVRVLGDVAGHRPRSLHAARGCRRRGRHGRRAVPCRRSRDPSGRRPSSARATVVLPHPDSPTIATRSPSATVRSMPRTAVVPSG